MLYTRRLNLDCGFRRRRLKCFNVFACGSRGNRENDGMHDAKLSFRATGVASDVKKGGPTVEVNIQYQINGRLTVGHIPVKRSLTSYMSSKVRGE